MYKTLSGPLVAQVEVATQCNNRCFHCYNFWRENNKSTFSQNLSIETADRVMEQLIRVKIFHIVFTGGEPLLNKNVLFKAIKKARDAGITVGINSNLIPLTFKDAEYLKQVGITSVLTSIMGPTSKEHDVIAQHKGAFEKTIKGIRFLQIAGVSVAVNMVVSQKNKHLLRETAQFVKSLGIKHFNSTRAGCPGNCGDFSEMSLSFQDFRDYLEELYNIGQQEQIKTDVLESYPLCAIKEVKRYKAFTGRHCFAGVTTLTVAVDGNVRPCSHLDISYGNIVKDELGDIWNRMQEWRAGNFLPLSCRFCKLLTRCGGCCRMEAKMRNGFFSALDPYAKPEDVDYVIDQLLTEENKTIVSLPSVFRLNPKIRWRIEDFGVVVFIGSRLACYLNSAAAELFQRLEISQAYQLSNFSNQYNGEAEKFLARLYDKHILISDENM